MQFFLKLANKKNYSLRKNDLEFCKLLKNSYIPKFIRVLINQFPIDLPTLNVTILIEQIQLISYK